MTHPSASPRTTAVIDPVLAGTALAMLGLLLASLVGMTVDPRTIDGAPAWLKPAKFAASTAIYAATLAWIFRYLPTWVRVRRYAGGITAAVFVLELAIIVTQALRGTTSHFNVATPFDTMMWSTMGTAIMVQTVASIAVAIAATKQAFDDRALGWAIRLGLWFTIVGASSGGLMAGPTAAQREAARAGRPMTIAGAHTVGAPDGGAGLPGTGWSRQHGDLRVPHFVGLHALQVLPLVVVAVSRRRRSDAMRIRLLLTAAASYAALFVLLTWQALRGQSLTQPDLPSFAALATWTALTVFGLWRVSTHPRRMAMPMTASRAR